MNDFTKKEKMDIILSEAKELLEIFDELKYKADVNKNSLILKHIDRTLIAKNIVPYLTLDDIVNFRSTCKDINSSVSSAIALVSYSKSIKPKHPKNSNIPPQLKNFKDVNEIDDIELELESVKRVLIKNNIR